MKLLAGVKESTPNDLVLLELGLPSCTAWIREKQRNFIDKTYNRNNNCLADWLNTARQAKSQIGIKIEQLVTLDNIRATDIQNRKEKIQRLTTTRFITYLRINPDLTPSPFTQHGQLVETDRIAATRIRLSSLPPSGN